MHVRIQQLLSAPFLFDTDERLIAELLNVVLRALMGVLGFLIFITPFFAPDVMLYWSLQAVFLLFAIGIFFILMARWSHVRLIGVIFLVGIWLYVTLVSALLGGVNGPFATGYVWLVLIAAALGGIRAGITYAVMSAVGALGILIVQAGGALPLYRDPIPLNAWWGLLMVNLFFAVRLRHFANRSVQSALASAQHEIAERKRVEATLRVAYNMLQRTADEYSSELSTTSRELEIQLFHRLRSEEAYKTLVEQSLQGMLIYQDGHIVFTNRAFARIVGYSVDELLSLSVDETSAIAHVSDRAVTLSRAQRILEGLPAPAQWAFRAVRKDGTLCWLEVSANRIQHQGRAAVQTIVIDVTDRQRAEEALRASETKLRAIVDHTKDIIYIKDTGGRYLLINPAGVKSVGRPIEEILGKSDQELWPADDLDDFQATDWQVLESRQPITFESRFHEDASRYVRHVSKFPYRSENGEVLGIVAISRDITDRVHAEEAEREQRLLAEALRNSAAAINSTLHLDEVLDRILDNVAHVVPHDAAVVLLAESDDARFARARGYSDEEIHDVLSTMRFSVSETPNLRRMTETGKALVIPDTHMDPDWVRRREAQWHHSYAGTPICRKGRVIGFISLFSATKDFFTTTHAERLQSFADQAAIAIENARLFEESERLRSFNQNIVQSMQEGILLTDASRHITFVNPKTAELLGYSPDELIGHHVSSYIAPDHRSSVDQEFAKRLHGIASRYETVLLTREEKRLPVLVSARPLFEDGQLNGVLTVFTDITERIRAEESIRRHAAYAEALAVISKVLTEAEMSYQSVLDTIVQNVGQLIGDGCVASLVSDAGDELNPVAFSHSNPEAAQLIRNLLEARGYQINSQVLIEQVIESSETILIPELPVDLVRESVNPDFWPYLDQYGVRSVIIVPLRARGQVIGTLSAIRDWGGQPYDKEDQTFLQNLADRAALAIINARLFRAVHVELVERKQAEEQRNRLFKEVREGRERLRVLSRRLLDTQETERRHLARELHDEVGQVLTLVKIDLQMAQRNTRSAIFRQKLAESIATVESAVEQVRDLSLYLRPPLLDDLGLIAALRWHTDSQTQRAGLRAHFVAEPLQKRLSPEIETICYRIVQEALTNVVRHAQAECVNIAVRQYDAHIELGITDDGVGFDVQAARQRAAQGSSQGLLNIEDRVLLGGGHVTIDSAPGAGTRIRVHLPLEPFSQAAHSSLLDVAA